MSVRFIESYVHNNRIGVLVELETSDDFVTRMDEFRSVARDLAMQIAATDPKAIDGSGLENVVPIAEGPRLIEEPENVLMSQEFIKDTSKSVADRVLEAETSLGAKIRIVRFVRFQADAT